MATALTTIFGNEINVAVGRRQAVRMRTGFAGAHGVTSVNLGSRGYAIVVTGTGRQSLSGLTFAQARAALEAALLAIENYQWIAADTYTYGTGSYYNVEFDKLEVLADGSGKQFYNTGSYVLCRFRAYLKGLI
jgi:hypothetical protein